MFSDGGVETSTPAKQSSGQTITVHRESRAHSRDRSREAAGDSEHVDTTEELSRMWESQGGATRTDPQTMTLIKELQVRKIEQEKIMLC